MKTAVNTSDNTNSTKNTNSPNTQKFLMMPYELLSVHEVNGQPFALNMKVAYQYIKGFQDNGQQAYFSRAKLGEILGMEVKGVSKLINKLIACGLVNRIERSGYTNLYTVNPIEQAAKNDTAAKSVAEEVKNESGPTVGNKAQSVKPSNSPTASTPEDIHNNNTTGIGYSDSAEPVNAAQPTQLPPVIVEEQPAQPAEAEEEEEEPDFNAYAAMAAPIALSGWVTTHNATVDLKAAYEAHRNANSESNNQSYSKPSSWPNNSTEHDRMEAF